jgi:hypothetical protein
LIKMKGRRPCQANKHVQNCKQFYASELSLKEHMQVKLHINAKSLTAAKHFAFAVDYGITKSATPTEHKSKLRRIFKRKPARLS